ncbi:DUF2125 domain-containing protein [Alphaproteobacteria bacterium GH1-50]|uniref:DUF2125 domain-containing protein n=1 Tax=Kangsaoukella pontilimi TaxID=2691042 RepID=A0A7C9MCH4_9RHOB|nr:DUF2125 domain-containing protein [Kangsaoukella pontilimi]MXQ09433.1 DUF2125 domain-containing protein [Kangsaoukella pontilimi]
MYFRKAAPLTAVLALATSPAFAVTPEEVWADWQTLITNYGATLEIGAESRSGETLTVTDVTVSTEMPDGAFDMELGTLTFTNIGDGAVRIGMAETVPMQIDVVTEDGDEASVGMVLRQSGATMTASGPRETLRYDFDYPLMSVGEFTMTGPEMPEDFPITMDMRLTEMSGYVALGDGEPRSYESRSTLAGFDMDVRFSDESGNGEGSGFFALSMADLDQTTIGTMAPIEAGATLAEMIASGTRQTGTATHGPVTYTVSFDGPDGSFEMAAAAERGNIEGALDENGINYGGNTYNTTITVGGSQFPLPPLTFRLAESGGVFRMPLVPGEEPQDFALVMRLVGLEIDDMLWSLFDPMGAISRDPATLVIDLGGSAMLTEDITAPDYADSDTPEVPGELESLDINALELSIAGARLTGDGAFEFDNSGDTPQPVGKANLALTGANQLIDTLVSMGLLPEEQAMAGRMMLGLFARPDGDDSYVSEIEVTEDGQVLANGGALPF